MNYRISLLKTLIVPLLLALFLEIFLEPTAPLDPYTSFGVILIAELLVLGAGMVVFRGRQAGRTVFTILGTSVVVSAFFVFILKPAVPVSWDQVFLIVFAIESLGLVAAWVLAR